MMRSIRFAMTAAAVAAGGGRHGAKPPIATSPSALVMELTGPAGEYGQAGAKSVEMAFRDINDAGGVGGCKLVTDTRDCQSQGNVAVDVATQLVQVKKVPVDHRRHHLLGVDPDPDLGHRARRGRAGLAGLLLADADPARPRRQDQRRLLPHHHLGRAAGHGGGEIRARPGPEEARRSSTSTTTSASTWWPSSRKAYKALGGTIVSATPYNEKQASYQAEVTAAMAGEPDGALSRQLSRSTARPSRAPGSRQGGPAKFLLNDGMN